MGKQYKALEQKDIDFIKKQKIFYLASSSGEEVNLSPKGYDSIRVLDKSTLLYLDFPGSGNRTYRDAMAGGEFTLMFTAFEGAPNITKLFCKAEAIAKDNEHFESYLSHFDLDASNVRQLFVFSVCAVETSCGMGVPYMKYEKERKSLKKWAKNMAEDGKLESYIEEHKEPPVLDYIKAKEDSWNDLLFGEGAVENVFGRGEKPSNPIETLMKTELETSIFHVEEDGHTQVEEVTHDLWRSPQELLVQIHEEGKWQDFYEAIKEMPEGWISQLLEHFPSKEDFSKIRQKLENRRDDQSL